MYEVRLNCKYLWVSRIHARKYFISLSVSKVIRAIGSGIKLFSSWNTLSCISWFLQRFIRVLIEAYEVCIEEIFLYLWFKIPYIILDSINTVSMPAKSMSSDIITARIVFGSRFKKRSRTLDSLSVSFVLSLIRSIASVIYFIEILQHNHYVIVW
jgi:hypothetical protein